MTQKNANAKVGSMGKIKIRTFGILKIGEL